MIRVLIADDQALVRAGFAVLVETAPDLEVVAQAADGAQAVALARRHRPDVVLMDIRMPVLDGLEAARQILADPEAGVVRVLMLTTFDLDEYVFGALRAGATGFLLKDTPRSTCSRRSGSRRGARRCSRRASRVGSSSTSYGCPSRAGRSRRACRA